MNSLVTFFRETAAVRFLAPLGVILVLFGGIIFRSANVTKNYLETESVVTRTELVEEADSQNKDKDELYTIYVKYTVDGVEYEEIYGDFHGYKEGDRIKILYNPADPTEIAQPGNTPLLALAFVIAGLGSLAGGIVSAIKAIRKQQALRAQEESWSNGN